MTKILIYRLGSLGDTVLVLPTLASIRRRYPQARITLLTNIPVAAKAAPMMEILEGTGIVDDVISYSMGTRDRKTLADLSRTLRKARFDLMYHLGPARGFFRSVRDAVFFRWCGIRKIVGLPLSRADLTCGPRPGRTDLYEWEALRLARRAGEVEIDLRDESLWELKLTSEETRAATARLEAAGINAPFIAASMGTKISANHWTVENWRRLFTLLGRISGEFALVAVGAADERAESDHCLEAWAGAKTNLCGQTSPREAAALLKKASLFLGHDSGLLHLAALAGASCVGIYSARNPPGQWFPKGDSHQIFYRRVDCLGCGLGQCLAQGKKCILSISPGEVASAALKLLGWGPGLEAGSSSDRLG